MTVSTERKIDKEVCDAKKIQHIKKLGVFDNFSWDSEVKNKGGAVQNFVDINIIYGRNYSGKTTLSRITRALETGYLSDKYVTTP